MQLINVTLGDTSMAVSCEKSLLPYAVSSSVLRVNGLTFAFLRIFSLAPPMNALHYEAQAPSSNLTVEDLQLYTIKLFPLHNADFLHSPLFLFPALLHSATSRS